MYADICETLRVVFCAILQIREFFCLPKMLRRCKKKKKKKKEAVLYIGSKREVFRL